jgi:hypothetical protein
MQQQCQQCQVKSECWRGRQAWGGLSPARATPPMTAPTMTPVAEVEAGGGSAGGRSTRGGKGGGEGGRGGEGGGEGGGGGGGGGHTTAVGESSGAVPPLPSCPYSLLPEQNALLLVPTCVPAFSPHENPEPTPS